MWILCPNAEEKSEGSQEWSLLQGFQTIVHSHIIVMFGALIPF